MTEPRGNADNAPKWLGVNNGNQPHGEKEAPTTHCPRLTPVEGRCRMICGALPKSEATEEPSPMEGWKGELGCREC